MDADGGVEAAIDGVDRTSSARWFPTRSQFPAGSITKLPGQTRPSRSYPVAVSRPVSASIAKATMLSTCERAQAARGRVTGMAVTAFNSRGLQGWVVETPISRPWDAAVTAVVPNRPSQPHGDKRWRREMCSDDPRPVFLRYRGVDRRRVLKGQSSVQRRGAGRHCFGGLTEWNRTPAPMRPG
jgi:hypothetical protein